MKSESPREEATLMESRLEVKCNHEDPDDEIQHSNTNKPFLDENPQVKVKCIEQLNSTPQQLVSSDKCIRNAPRVIKVCGSFLQQRPRRFRIINSDDQYPSKEEPIDYLDMSDRPSVENAQAQKPENQVPKPTAQETSHELALKENAAFTPKAQCLPQSLGFPPKMDILDVATAIGGKQAAGRTQKKRSYMVVNGISYMRVGLLGKGGSSRVYRVIGEREIVLALKRVDIKNVDEPILRGYKSEIDLLKRLARVRRVVSLLDWELDSPRGVLNLVMEFGNLDLESVLKSEINKPNAYLDLTYVRFYWKEMLECVAAVHAFNIVHSDLKPANFVVVQGCLKIIDFGIANLIGDDTVNVHRDQQVGTPNYMAPESLLDISQSSENWLGGPDKLIKVGKPSDIWSLGCILYQMTYGKAPFAHIPNHMRRAMTIINSNHTIEYPALGIGGAKIPLSMIRTMKGCLNWDQKLRPAIDELLSSSNTFLYPENPQVRNLDGPLAVDMSEAQLGSILRNVARFCEGTSATPTTEEVEDWSKAFYKKLREI